MKEKPELIAYTYYLLGGSASFYKNLFGNNPDDYFDVRGIILRYNWKDQIAPVSDIRIHEKDTIIDVSFSDYIRTSKKITQSVSNKKGLIVCCDTNELMAYDLFRTGKSIYFICHDDAYVMTVKKYESIIDVIIAHNISVYNDILKLLPNRKDDIYYIPHGIEIQPVKRETNYTEKLKIVFLARNHTAKGIYDLIEIDKLLKNKKIEVEWTILGDGPERENFKNKVSKESNFNFLKPLDNNSLFEILRKQDISILPSRLDGLPVSLLEAMSMGCVPIVSKFNAGITSLITKDNGYVLEIGDNTAFANAISFLDVNRNILDQMSLGCINKIAQDHNITNQAKKYFDLFKKFEEKKKVKKRSVQDVFRIFENFQIVKYTKRKIVEMLQIIGLKRNQEHLIA